MPDSFWTGVFGKTPVREPVSTSSQAWWQDPPSMAPQPPAASLPVLGAGQLTTEQVARQAQQEGRDVSRALHLRNEDNCPACGGGDYLKVMGGRARCFDCGYPIIQQGSGVSVSTNKGTPARQVSSGGKLAHNYHPEVIEDRIS